MISLLLNSMHLSLDNIKTMFQETLIPSDPSVPLQFYLAAAAPIDRKGVGVCSLHRVPYRQFPFW